MSGLNKAFIRAYSKDLPSSGATSGTSVPIPNRPQNLTILPSSITIVVSDSQSERRNASVTSDSQKLPEEKSLRTALRTESAEAGGTWYASEAVSSSRQGVLPTPHLRFPSEPILVGRETAEPTTADATTTREAQAAPQANAKPQANAAGVIHRFDPPVLKSVSAPHFTRSSKPATPNTNAAPRQEEPAPEAPSPKPVTDPHPNDDEFAQTVAAKLHERATAIEPATALAADETVSDVVSLAAHREALLLASSAARPKFQPVWEVDSFRWTETCDKVLSSAFDLFSEASNELKKACEGGLRVLAISSSQRGEGRSTVTHCLARALATAGVRVAMLDADLENPSLAESLNLDISCGWDDAVHGELPLAEAAVYSLGDRVTVLPLAEDFAKRDFLLSDTRVTATLKKLAECFDLVLVDMGPAGPAERRLFAGGSTCPIDAALVVRDMRLTSLEQAHTTAARLKANGIRSVGLIENFVS